MAIDSVLHTNRHSIDRVLTAGLPVLLVFWRGDVAASRDYDDLLDRLAADYAGKALIAKVDAAAEPPLVQRFGIQLLPSVVVLRNGTALATLAGRVPDQAVSEWLAYAVNGGSKPAVASGQGVPAVSERTPTERAPAGNGRSPRAADQATSVRGQAPAGQVVTLTDATFDAAVNGSLPVLVDFWAVWCGPCRMVAPVVEELAKEFAGRAVVGKLNVDENQRTAQRFNVMSIPTLLIFRNGRVIDQIVGAQPAPVLRQRLARAVGT
jgi:thioredoxin 1